jgi:putative addiction module killer protein
MDYEVATTDEFDSWLDAQADDVREMIATRLIRAQSGNLGDHASIGGKVRELRFHAGAGYRVYYTVQGRVLIVLLCGGTKKSQKKDIKKAKDLAAEL